MLNLVPRPVLDEEIWVRGFVMLALGSYSFNPVIPNLFSVGFSVIYTYCWVQLSFLVWLAGFSVRECFIFFLHTKASVNKRESLLVWLFSINC